MRVSQIEDVDVIANTSSIRCVVIGSVDFDVRFFTERHLQHSRNEMRLRPMVLAEFLGCAGGIEIAQANKFQPVNFVVPAQHFLEHEFGFAVRIDRTRLRGFIDWQAIGRSKRSRMSTRRRCARTPVATIASSRFNPLQTLFRKYLDGFCIDSPTSALAAKCITASGR